MKTHFTLFAAVSFALAGIFAGFPARTVYAQETVRPRTTPPAATTPTPIVDDDEPIRIDTELVNLSVRVIDRNNRPITNLPQSEFTIFEDNVAQRIEFFSQSEMPTNYSLVIDNSGSLRQQINEVIDASKSIVNTNRAGDETSVIRFVSSDKIEIVQDFTNDKEYVGEALDNLYIEGGRTAIIDAVYLAAQRVAEYERSNDRLRRALILVTDGEDVSSFYTQKQLFDLLTETDVQIFVVGFVKDLDSKGGFISKSAQSKAKSFLEALATQTGGKAYFPDNVSQMQEIARDISGEMRTQYSIGYIPTNDKNDGTFRNIRVNVSDGPSKQKRIAVTRSGRTAVAPNGAPTLQRSN